MSHITYEFNENEVIVNNNGMPCVQKPFDKEALYSLLDKMTKEQLDELIEDINDEKRLREFKEVKLKKVRSRMNRELKIYKQELENQKQRMKMHTEQEEDYEEEEEEKQQPKRGKKIVNRKK